MMSPMRASGMFRSSSYPKPDTPENISTISSPRKVRPNVSRKALVNAGSALGTTILQITAARLIRKLHTAGVIHNDLAKETNWLVTPDGHPALVDFQLAMTLGSTRGALARALGHDDLRHLLKHKRSYLPEKLTAREKRILAKPSLLSRIWMASGKRVYLFVTRKIFRWRDREGAGDRSATS